MPHCCRRVKRRYPDFLQLKVKSSCLQEPEKAGLRLRMSSVGLVTRNFGLCFRTDDFQSSLYADAQWSNYCDTCFRITVSGNQNRMCVPHVHLLKSRRSCHLLRLYRVAVLTSNACSMYPPCCWTTHSSRRRHWAIISNGAISGVARLSASSSSKANILNIDVRTAGCDSYFRQ